MNEELIKRAVRHLTIKPRFRLARLWRRLRNRCQMCNEPRSRSLRPNDFHSLGPYCRRCNKIMNFGASFGMGRERFEKQASR